LFGIHFHKENLSKHNGFTLLELLIVIGIIAILSVALVFILNPSETLKKARDSQRMSDLTTLKKAIEIYKTNERYPKLAGSDNTGCKGTTSSDTNYVLASDKIYYSYPSDIGGAGLSAINTLKLDGVTFTTGGANQVTKANLGNVDNTGWLPINFASLQGGSPISSLPIDPVNTIADRTKPTMTDLVYRYICSEKTLGYEIDAVLESTAYTITDLKMQGDGGNNDSYYEVGTNLELFNMESPLLAGTYTIVGPDHLPYRTVIGEDGLEWLDRNLGATQVASLYNDTASYGHYYQWGRYADGHQIKDSTSITGPVNTDTPGSSFVKVANANPWDWRAPAQTLWLGVDGKNNPCPSGFRIPTKDELAHLFSHINNFTTATCGSTSSCLTTAVGSSLKLPSGGYRDYSSAGLGSQGSTGYYWSSTVSGVYAYSPVFNATSVYPTYGNYRAYGLSVRCLKDY
jgi:uncharacterized protein (TIGR02145 family)/prepilin-type N-terminal cleavage/methylation domain-containing protein